MFDFIFLIIEIIGTIAFAISGALRGIEKDLDLLGITVLGMITATGGGMLRDLFLGITPPNLFVNPHYALLATVTAIIVFCIAYITAKCQFSFKFVSRITFDILLNLADAIGLGIFAVIGVETVIAKGLMDHSFLAICCGTLTGVGGGILRDVLINEIPFVLKKHIYFVAALAGSLCYYLAIYYECNDIFAMLSGIILTFIIRILASKYRWNLPRIPRK